jgi:hypothetical protein
LSSLMQRAVLLGFFSWLQGWFGSSGVSSSFSNMRMTTIWRFAFIVKEGYFEVICSNFKP